MWINKKDNQSIFTGALWKPQWTASLNGIMEDVVDVEDNYGFPHAFKIAGWKTIDGVPYLICVLSNGTEIGDKGLFYMPREIANKDLTYGCFTFTSMPKILAKTAHNLPFLKKLIKLLKKIYDITIN
jgi:hypothetical protein